MWPEPCLYSSTVLLLCTSSGQMLKAGQPSHRPEECYSSPHLLSVLHTVRSNMAGHLCKLSPTYLRPGASRFSSISLQSSKEHEIWGLTAWTQTSFTTNELLNVNDSHELWVLKVSSPGEQNQMLWIKTWIYNIWNNKGKSLKTVSNAI